MNKKKKKEGKECRNEGREGEKRERERKSRERRVIFPDTKISPCNNSVPQGVLRCLKGYSCLGKITVSPKVHNDEILGTQCIKLTCTGLLVGRGKRSQISRDFQGQIRGKNCRFCGNFAGLFEASFAEK